MTQEVGNPFTSTCSCTKHLLLMYPLLPTGSKNRGTRVPVLSPMLKAPSAFQTLIVSLVLSRLHYGNTVLVGLPVYLSRRLQSVMKAAAWFASSCLHHCFGQFCSVQFDTFFNTNFSEKPNCAATLDSLHYGFVPPETVP